MQPASALSVSIRTQSIPAASHARWQRRCMSSCGVQWTRLVSSVHRESSLCFLMCRHADADATAVAPYKQSGKCAFGLGQRSDVGVVPSWTQIIDRFEEYGQSARAKSFRSTAGCPMPALIWRHSATLSG